MSRGLHNRQVFQVAKFLRERAQPGAEGTPLLAVIFPRGLQASAKALAEAPQTTAEMVSDEAVEHRVDGGVGEAQGEGERSQVPDGPVNQAAVQPAFAPQQVQEGHTVEREPAEEESHDDSSDGPQDPLQPPAFQAFVRAGSGIHTCG